MIDAQNGVNVNPFEDHLERECSPRSIPSKDSNPSFIKIPVVIACTVVVFVLIVAGTATTAISFPPEPPDYHQTSDSNPNRERLEPRTALDGDFKLLGPLLIMAGGFLLIVDVVLCVVITKEAYSLSRGASQNDASPMSLLGGPYFLAVPSSSANHHSVTPFAFARQLWTLPNAPLPDFTMDGGPLKGSWVRPSTAVLNQPPFNPDVDTPSPTVEP